MVDNCPDSRLVWVGIVGIIAGIFHITTRPPERLYKALRMGNIETVLASAIAAVFFSAFVVAGTEAGSKLAKAGELGIEVWDEDRLVAFLAQH